LWVRKVAMVFRSVDRLFEGFDGAILGI
jgi:hypothetical protein